MNRRRKINEFIATNSLRLMVFISIGFLFLFLIMIFRNGFGVINWTFISQAPKNGMTEGGI